MEQVVEALRRVIRAMNEGFEKQTSILIGYLEPIRDLPRIIGEVRKDMIRGLSDVAKAQVMVAIAEQKGKHDARQELIQLEQEQLAALAVRLEEEQERIQESAEKKASRVDADLHASIEEMDGPLLDLGREFFPALIFGPYATDLVPGWQLLASVRHGTTIGRNLILGHDLEQLKQRVERYEEHCRTLREQVQTLASQRENAADAELLIPVLLVETRRRERSESHVDVFIAPDTNSSGHLRTLLPGFQKRIKERLQQKMTEVRQMAERIDLLEEAAQDVTINLTHARKLSGGVS